MLCASHHTDGRGLVPTGPICGECVAHVVHPAQPGARWELALARRVECPHSGVGPGLPAMAQEADRLFRAARRRPAEPEDHGVELQRDFTRVANRALEGRCFAVVRQLACDLERAHTSDPRREIICGKLSRRGNVPRRSGMTRDGPHANSHGREAARNGVRKSQGSRVARASVRNWRRHGGRV